MLSNIPYTRRACARCRNTMGASEPFFHVPGGDTLCPDCYRLAQVLEQVATLTPAQKRDLLAELQEKSKTAETHGRELWR